MREDRHFVGEMAAKFERSLYGASRGQLRLALLQDTVARELPLSAEPLLDAGGGLGQMAEWAALRGHAVTLVEPAQEMLSRACERLAGLDVRCLQGDLQSLERLAPGPWPRIFCHAVLEWLAEPRAGLEALAAQLAPGGWMSLMVFNRDALRFSNVIKGNLERVLEDRLAGDGRRTRLTPISPLGHDEVIDWLDALGLEVHGVTGIRVFHDYLRSRHPSEEELVLLRRLEFAYCRAEPYWRLGRYLHYSVHRPA